MPRSMWMGTLNFGLVSMPVRLYTATMSRSVHFHQLHAADHARIQQRRVCSADGEEVPYEEVVRGYELAPERYVVIEDDELDAIAPQATRTIEIEDFVQLDEIDRIYFDQPYYIVPQRGGARSYRLLLQAMSETGKVAIARVVLRSRERLVAVYPREDVLMMTTLHYGDEVNPTSELRELQDEREANVNKRELEVARRLVDSLSEPFDITRYRDTYREAVLELIDRKASGEEVVVEPRPAVEVLQAPDLMGALQASLDRARAGAGAQQQDGATGAARAGGGAGAAKRKKKMPASPASKAGNGRSRAKSR
jgi:DNA end-binding protein Ku